MIANCKRCGRIFQKVSRDICPTCIQEQHEFVKVIKDYLRHHKHATVLEVAKATNIDVEDIADLIDERLLILVDYPNMTLTCERCGIPTHEGRMCHACRDELVKELADMTRVVRSLKQSVNGSGHGYYSRPTLDKD